MYDITGFVMILPRPLLAAVAAVVWLLTAMAAQAAVTVTFWSHELGNSFPHAFFTLRGVPDAGGPPVDVNYGFTARTLSPAILFGTVAGKLDIAKPFYMAGSDARFSVILTDRQYADLLALVAAWSGKNGDSRYNLNRRNCVHFVREAARLAGLTGLDHPGLMKKPRSFLKAVAAANPGRVVVLNLPGRAYLATLPALPAPTR
ncbi:hypothetical protein [Sphingomonas sp. CFBP 8760]|uniref:hypothetical protein n=1 Tax=Sphingomonas sp. CFBP 8760 TaxID=2775282 RepID=UPI0031456118